MSEEECDFAGTCPNKSEKPATEASKGQTEALKGLNFRCVPRSSLSDDREYRAVELENGLVCVLARDATSEKGAASLCVGVGAYSDDPSHYGLAHFLEHMLFQGTKTFPEDNSYKAFVARHGGSTNASTSGEQTCFQFDVVDDELEGALERFGLFFVEPLLKAECIDREMHAVDAEHSKNVNDDGRRAYQMLRVSASRDHPFSNFSTGNLDTLQIPNVRDKLLTLWKDRYDPKIATACIVSRRSLDELEVLAIKHFGAMSHTGSTGPYPDVEKMVQASLFDRTCVIYEHKPVRELRSLRVLWPLSFGLRDRYFNGGERVVTHALGHEGPGSLLAYLKARGWAHGLSTGVSPNLHDVACFSLSVDLTPVGEEKRYSDVLPAIFKGVGALWRNLRSDPHLAKRLWDEIAVVAAARFDFAYSKASPYGLAPSLARAAGDYAPEDVLVTCRPGLSTKMDGKWAPERSALVLTLVKELCDPRKIIVHCATKYCGLRLGFGEVEKEPFYGIEHASRDLTVEEREKLESAVDDSGTPDCNQELRAPAPNPYLPDPKRLVKMDFDLKCRAESSKEPPLFYESKGVYCWFKTDTTFGQPKAYVTVRVASDELGRDVTSWALTKLWVRTAMEMLKMPLYDATCSALSYDVSEMWAERSVDVDVSGLVGDGMTRLLDATLEGLASPQTYAEDAYDRCKERLQRSLVNSDKGRADSHAARWRREAMEEHRPTVDALRSAVGPLSLDDVRRFASKALESPAVLLHAHGAVSKADVDALVNAVSARLNPPTPALAWPDRSRLLHLPRGTMTIKRASPNAANDVNSAVQRVYDLGARTDLKRQAMVSLLVHVMKEPFFTQLRTREQLGYLVSARYGLARNRLLLILSIQSQVKDPLFVSDRLNAFLDTFRPQSLGDIKFQQAKESLATKWTEPDTSMHHEAHRFWSEIENPQTDGAPHFDRPYDIAKHVRNIDLAEIGQVYDSLKTDRARVLEVQVFGKDHVLLEDAVTHAPAVAAPEYCDPPPKAVA